MTGLYTTSNWFDIASIYTIRNWSILFLGNVSLADGFRLILKPGDMIRKKYGWDVYN